MKDDTAVKFAARRLRRGDVHGALRLLQRQAQAEPDGYPCCVHCGCPNHSTGHPVPCTRCSQPLIVTADQLAARAMAEEARA